MLDPEKVDFKKMGFKAGIEVHHQIDTKRKLFCNCVPKLSYGEPDYRFERYFRPVLGEMGDFDEGMLIEYEKGYRVIYHAHEDSVCVYEQDEQPPFWPDQEAIYKGYELAQWLNCSALVDEVVVSRKQYLDGSITTGFQRTMIVARDGWVPVNGKKITITNLTVEEDAARKFLTENNGRTVYYNLDRLGIPLVEVITDHEDCDNPDDLKKAAEYIGLTLRLSGIGRRGIGSARQDVNISIKGGRRVEIKGVQDLDTFVDLARREVVRQHMLIEIALKLKERKLNKNDLEHTYIDVTDHFDKKLIPKNYIIMGIRLPYFGGILGLEIQPGKDFGQDIIEKTELIAGIPRANQFHSDEVKSTALRKLQEEKLKAKNKPFESNFFFQNVTSEVDKKLRKDLQLKKEDAYFLAIGPQKWAIHAMKKIIERAKLALDGVPEETRRFLPDNNTEFLRVIHGKDRLYPDTDTPPIEINIDKVNQLQQSVGKRPWEWEKILEEKFGFSFDKVLLLIRHDSIDLLLEIVEKYKADPNRVYQFLEETLLALQREDYDISILDAEQIGAIFKGIDEKLYDYNQIPNIAKNWIKNPKKNLQQILSDMKIKKIELKDLERFFDEALNEINQQYKDDPQEKIMNRITGIIMRRINGGFSGKEVHSFVSQKMIKTGGNN
ncbi:MAG: Glu-tRNA(Gln) amidotransferase subunit GatE [Candidatus Thorarchaeota archaeon]